MVGVELLRASSMEIVGLAKEAGGVSTAVKEPGRVFVVFFEVEAGVWGGSEVEGQENTFLGEVLPEFARNQSPYWLVCILQDATSSVLAQQDKYEWPISPQ